MTNEALLVYKKLTLAEGNDFGEDTVTDGTKLLELASDGVILGQNPGIINPVTINGTAALQRHFTGTYSPGFDINCLLRSKDVALLILKAAMGTLVTTQPDVTNHPTVYQHKLTIDEEIVYGLSKGLCFQAKIASGKVYDILDCIINSFSIEHTVNAEIGVKARVEGRKIATSVATLASITRPTQNPFIFHQATFKIDTVAKKLSQCVVNFNNNYKLDLFANEQYRSRFVRNGVRNVGGTLTFPMVDSDTFALYTAWLAGSSAVLQMYWEGAAISGTYKYKVQIDIPNAVYAFTDIPGGGGAEVPQGAVPFIALEDPTNGKKEIEITIVNNSANFYY